MSNTVNKAFLIVRLGNKPELRKLKNSDREVATFRGATDVSFKDKSGEWHTLTTWHNIAVFGPAAAHASNKLDTGCLAYIEGHIVNHPYEKNGVTAVYSEVVCESFRLLTSKKVSAESQTPQEPEQPEHNGSSDNIPDSAMLEYMESSFLV